MLLLVDFASDEGVDGVVKCFLLADPAGHLADSASLAVNTSLLSFGEKFEAIACIRILYISHGLLGMAFYAELYGIFDHIRLVAVTACRSFYGNIHFVFLFVTFDFYH